MRFSSQHRVLEFLQNFSFMLWEVPTLLMLGKSGVTAKDMIIPVLNPLVGFQSITAPEMTANAEEINVGNQNYPYKYITNWAYGAITLTRGCTISRVDFSSWVYAYQKGYEIRRNFVLVHFTRSKLFQSVVPPISLFTVPARTWFLEGCQPIRYKAASDFDAHSSDVSIEELDIDPLKITDFGAAGINTIKSLIPG
jgi:phage tail-like protein